MRTWLWIPLMALLAWGAAGAHLYVNLGDAGLNAATNRVVLVTGNSLPRSSASTVVVQDKLRFNSGTNGAFWLSNAVPGVYLFEVQAPPARTEFRVLVPDTNIVVIAAENLVADSRNVFPAGTVAWSADAADRRYQRRSETGSLLFEEGGVTVGRLMIDP